MDLVLLSFFLENCGFFFNNGGIIRCVCLVVNLFWIKNFLLVMILFFFESLLRKLDWIIIFLLEIDLVYKLLINE